MIDITKKYKTRSGREVIKLFHYPENEEGYKIIAHIKDEQGEVYCESYYEDGTYAKGRDNRDLIPVPTIVTRWFNVYESEKGNDLELGNSFGYASEDEAKNNIILPMIHLKTISIEAEIP